MFREIRGELVHVVEHGSGGPTILGLTGVFGNVEIWEQPFELLHRRYRTIAYDHFGTGLTHVPVERVTFDEQVALVADVLEAFEVDRCVLVGDSSCTQVAVAAAHRWPDRVAGLVLSSGEPVNEPDERTHRFVAGLRHAFDDTLEAFVAACLPEDDHGHLRRWLHAIISRTGPQRAAHLVESFYGVDVRPLLGSITVPTVVVHGAQDRIHPLSGGEAFAAGIPDAELVVIDDAGHVPTLSRPQRIADTVSDLVERVGD